MEMINYLAIQMLNVKRNISECILDMAYDLLTRKLFDAGIKVKLRIIYIQIW